MANHTIILNSLSIENLWELIFAFQVNANSVVVGAVVFTVKITVMPAFKFLRAHLVAQVDAEVVVAGGVWLFRVLSFLTESALFQAISLPIFLASQLVVVVFTAARAEDMGTL